MTDFQPCVVWITGLSGSGKTTLATSIVERFRRDDHPVIFLDGDELRQIFGFSTFNSANHGREARLQLAMQYAKLCHILSCQGTNVVIATISLFREVHQWNRLNLRGYFEVYIKVPFDELLRRDPKKIYQRYYSGELTNVAGLDIPIDEPLAPDYLINFSQNQSVSDSSKSLFQALLQQNVLHSKL